MKPATSSTPSCGERVFDALLLLKRGLTVGEVAAILPNLLPQAAEQGVSPKSAEIIIRQGQRVLLSGIIREQRPATLPDELWPPETVREEIAASNTWRSKLAALRRWLHQHPATPGGQAPLAQANPAAE